MTNKVKTIFQDDAILVIEKPSGLITISENAKDETLATLIKAEYGIGSETSIVHRLDRDTSGVMVIAKNKQVHDQLQDQFKDRKIKKEYIALVHGSVEKGGMIDVSLGRIPGGGNKFVANDEGRLASTVYEPAQLLVMSPELLERIFSKKELSKLQTTDYKLYTLLKCQPLTGRTHQIRVHLKHINHPIVTDPLYAGRKTYKLDLMWCPRLFLHAAKLGLNHPESEEWVEFDSRLPEELENTLKLLK